MTAGQAKWTAEDEDFLLTNARSMSASQLSDAMGRSAKSIQRKAARMRLPIWRDDQFGDGLRDLQGKVQIGSRRLLAKTCPKCGRFLMARRFFRRKSGNRNGHWYVNCIGCTGQINNARPRDHRTATQRNQQATQRTAINTGRPWTSEDDTIIRDTEHYPSVMEAATVLGRTYEAVTNRAKELGVRRSNFADVGMYWTIRFDHPHDLGHGIGARMESEEEVEAAGKER